MPRTAAFSIMIMVLIFVQFSASFSTTNNRNVVADVAILIEIVPHYQNHFPPIKNGSTDGLKRLIKDFVSRIFLSSQSAEHSDGIRIGIALVSKKSLHTLIQLRDGRDYVAIDGALKNLFPIQAGDTDFFQRPESSSSGVLDEMERYFFRPRYGDRSTAPNLIVRFVLAKQDELPRYWNSERWVRENDLIVMTSSYGLTATVPIPSLLYQRRNHLAQIQKLNMDRSGGSILYNAFLDTLKTCKLTNGRCHYPNDDCCENWQSPPNRINPSTHLADLSPQYSQPGFMCRQCSKAPPTTQDDAAPSVNDDDVKTARNNNTDHIGQKRQSDRPSQVRNDQNTQKDQKIPVWAIVMIVSVCAAVVIVIVAIVFAYYRTRSRRRRSNRHLIEIKKSNSKKAKKVVIIAKKVSGNPHGNRNQHQFQTAGHGGHKNRAHNPHMFREATPTPSSSSASTDKTDVVRRKRKMMEKRTKLAGKMPSKSRARSVIKAAK